MRQEGVSEREAFAFLLSVSRGTKELTLEQTAILLDFADRTKRTIEQVIDGAEEAANRAQAAFPSQHPTSHQRMPLTSLGDERPPIWPN